jgi:predicted Zn-dependent protease
VTRLALVIVSLAAVAWLGSAWPGTRDDERARDIRPAAGRPLSPAQVERSIALLEGARRARPDGDVVPRLAGLELTAGHPDRAVALLRPLLRHEPDNVAAWTVLAFALADSDPRAAREAQERRRALAPPVEP